MLNIAIDCYKYEIYKIPKCIQFWHEMLKIASVSGALPQTPLGELTTLPQAPSREELNFCFRQSHLRAFGARNFTYSHVLIGLGIPVSRFPRFPSRFPLLNS